MRVLLTGHDGYLGNAVFTRLRESGHEVVGLDTGFFAQCLLGAPPEPVTCLRADLRDVRPDNCAGFDAVVHLAALSNDSLGYLDTGITNEINYHSTVRLASAAKRAGVTRFLFSSSCSLYGAGDGEAVLGEDAAVAPVTPYGQSKILSEYGLQELADDDFSPVYLRNATAYGLSPRHRTDLVVNDLVASALLTGDIRLRSDGTAWRPLIHVEDIAAAFVALLEAPREVVHNKAYNVGITEENYTVRDIARLVQTLLPGSEMSFDEDAKPDGRSYRVSCDLLAREVPSFAPMWTLRKGVEQLVDGYRRYGLNFDDAFAGRFQRVKQIQALRQAGRLDSTLRWCDR